MRRARRVAGALVLGLCAERVSLGSDMPGAELLEFIGEWKDDELVLEAGYPSALDDGAPDIPVPADAGARPSDDGDGAARAHPEKRRD